MDEAAQSPSYTIEDVIPYITKHVIKIADHWAARGRLPPRLKFIEKEEIVACIVIDSLLRRRHSLQKFLVGVHKLSVSVDGMKLDQLGEVVGDWWREKPYMIEDDVVEESCMPCQEPAWHVRAGTLLAKSWYAGATRNQCKCALEKGRSPGHAWIWCDRKSLWTLIHLQQLFPWGSRCCCTTCGYRWVRDGYMVDTCRAMIGLLQELPWSWGAAPHSILPQSGFCSTIGKSQEILIALWYSCTFVLKACPHNQDFMTRTDQPVISKSFLLHTSC